MVTRAVPLTAKHSLGRLQRSVVRKLGPAVARVAVLSEVRAGTVHEVDDPPDRDRLAVQLELWEVARDIARKPAWRPWLRLASARRTGGGRPSSASVPRPAPVRGCARPDPTRALNTSSPSRVAELSRRPSGRPSPGAKCSSSSRATSAKRRARRILGPTAAMSAASSRRSASLEPRRAGDRVVVQQRHDIAPRCGDTGVHPARKALVLGQPDELAPQRRS